MTVQDRFTLKAGFKNRGFKITVIDRWRFFKLIDTELEIIVNTLPYGFISGQTGWNRGRSQRG